MSWKLTGIVAHKQTGSAVRRLVLLTMCDKANDDGSGVYASFATLAQDCELSRATAKRTIKEFESEGLVRQVGTQPCANGETNDYTVSVTALRALPDLPKRDKKQGSGNTQVKANPVQPEPGLQGEPGSERTPTRVTVTPKPILEPIAVAVAATPARDFKALIKEAQERAGAACNLTSGNVHHVADLRRMLDAGCDWDLDVLPAIDCVAAGATAKRKQIHSWGHPGLIEAATTNRDRRLQGLPPPELANDHGLGASRAFSAGARANARPQPRSATSIIMERALHDELEERERKAGFNAP